MGNFSLLKPDWERKELLELILIEMFIPSENDKKIMSKFASRAALEGIYHVGWL